MAAGQDRPPAYMEVFRGVSEALANLDADAFLDQFDPKSGCKTCMHWWAEGITAELPPAQ